MMDQLMAVAFCAVLVLVGYAAGLSQRNASMDKALKNARSRLIRLSVRLDGNSRVIQSLIEQEAKSNG